MMPAEKVANDNLVESLCGRIADLQSAMQRQAKALEEARDDFVKAIVHMQQRAERAEAEAVAMRAAIEKTLTGDELAEIFGDSFSGNAGKALLGRWF